MRRASARAGSVPPSPSAGPAPLINTVDGDDGAGWVGKVGAEVRDENKRRC